MTRIYQIKQLLRELQEDAKDIDRHALETFCLVFALVGGFMCCVNLSVRSYHMAGITGGLGLFLLLNRFLFRKKKNTKLLIVNIAVVMTVMMLYFLVNGGEAGFSSAWMYLLPPVAMYFLGIYYGGIFSFLLAFATLVYMWTPLHAIGFPYIQTYLTRFPVVYLSDTIICFCIQYRISRYKSRQRELLKEAETASRAKSDFLSNMSHEVRTPINAILGYNELIMKETQESHTAAYAVNVQTAGRTLLTMVSNILDFTSMDQETIAVADEPYSVYSLLHDIFSYAEYYTEEKELALTVDFDEQIPQMLSGDVAHIMQIVNHLISNAVKYTREGYVKLTVKWQEKDETCGALSVAVEDSGIGMEQQDIENISSAFSRFDYKMNRDVQGLGLGIPIVQRLLDLMGSRLDIRSEYGKGSCFSFVLTQTVIDRAPVGAVAFDRGYALVASLQEEPLKCAAGTKILAADDTVMNLDLLKRMLKDTGIQIDTATNGQEALALLESNTYHMILLDHMMPVLDGIETLRLIRERNLCDGNVPIIVLTANAVSGAKEMYLAAGFHDYITKPILQEQLFSLMRKYLPKELLICGHIAETVTGEPGPISDSGSFLEWLPFLDTQTGMQYCCNSEDFYREMLQSYVDSKKLDAIEEQYREEDWENYRISVHALKSTSLSIGAVNISEQAKQLEFAAKEDRIDYIREHHEIAMLDYGILLEKLRDVLEGKTDAPQQSGQNEGPHILVVDDDPMNIRIAEKMLAEHFCVFSARSGMDALETLTHELPDLILLDLHMPEMDGFEVIRRLKEDARYREIPVLFLTADNDRDMEVRGFQEGAMDFITKPFVADIMISRVNRILELNRLQKNLQQEVDKRTRESEERREKIERLSLQVMKTLSKTIDAKDKYTNGHSMRVAEYSREIARRLGKSETEQEDIYHMGLLHDIGKIGIPDEIINKPSRLTDEEYAVIKSHPVIGVEILKNISELPEISIGARWHHERYDGGGYPDGLAGEHIPLVARIIGVADTYDAMTSKRSYRDVLPQDVVKDELKKGIGTQLDPQCAQIMLEMIEEDQSYQMRER